MWKEGGREGGWEWGRGSTFASVSIRCPLLQAPLPGREGDAAPPPLLPTFGIEPKRLWPLKTEDFKGQGLPFELQVPAAFDGSRPGTESLGLWGVKKKFMYKVETQRQAVPSLLQVQQGSREKAFVPSSGQWSHFSQMGRQWPTARGLKPVITVTSVPCSYV